MHVIAIHGVRGGSGRTALALVLASALAAQQRRVLVLDATRPGHIPDWTRIAQGGRDRLSRRVSLARARDPRQLERALPLARAAGFELALIDTPGWAAELQDPLVEAALRAAHLILFPLGDPDLAHIRPAMEEFEALWAMPLAAVATGLRAGGRAPALRAAWEARGAAPGALLRAALGHRAAFRELGSPAWLHARHAELMAHAGGRRPDLAGAGVDVTDLFDRQPHDPARLEDHAEAVREANLVAAEVLLRLEGLHPVPLASPDDGLDDGLDHPWPEVPSAA